MPAPIAIPRARPLSALSPEVKNILDAPPTWLVRWGSLFLFGAILLLLLSAGLVRYPRVITGQATIHAAAHITPIELPAGTTACSLRVRPQQAVEAGQLLAIVRQGTVERAITAPAAGIILAPTGLNKQVVLRLLPRVQAGYSTVALAAKLAPRVRVGQSVLISLNAYPSDKFGQLPGHIVSIAKPTEANQATVAVALDQGYQSTHGILLPMMGSSYGTAQIITTDKSMLSSFLSSRL